MGDTDKSISYCLYTPYILENVNLKDVKNIAWLGWKDENVLIEDINKRCTNLEKNDLYDIDTSEGASYWDINEDWDISGYDLVVCLRTTLFVKDKNHFLRNLKKLINDNKKVIFDFILPPAQYMSNFSKSERMLLEQIGINYETEMFFSWLEIYQETKAKPGPTQYNDMGLVIQEDVELQVNNCSSGYCLLPCFDQIIYPKSYKSEVGVNFKKETSEFITMEEKEMLLEEDLNNFGLEELVKSIRFAYFLNHSATWAVSEMESAAARRKREKICTTLFTFEKKDGVKNAI